MITEEAIEELKRFRNLPENALNHKKREALTLGIHALEDWIPMEVIRGKMPNDVDLCPKCRGIVGWGMYCGNCGQRLRRD